MYTNLTGSPKIVNQGVAEGPTKTLWTPEGRSMVTRFTDMPREETTLLLKIVNPLD